MTAPLPGALTPAMRGGVEYAIHCLDRLAAALGDTFWGRAYADAAAALREELKIAGEGG